MIFTQPLSFISEFVEELDRGIRECAPNRKLSTIQRYWLSFCLMGILLSDQVCWAAFERVGLGGYSQAALSKRRYRGCSGMANSCGRCCCTSASC